MAFHRQLLILTIPMAIWVRWLLKLVGIVLLAGVWLLLFEPAAIAA